MIKSVSTWPDHIGGKLLPRIPGLGSIPTFASLQPTTKISAVLMLFCPFDTADQPTLLFIRRAAHLRKHSGQIAFPGGQRDVADESPVDTALRETHEELGIHHEMITVCGALPIVNALDGHPVIPIVGYVQQGLGSLRLNYDEVAAAFFVPWTSLTAAHRQTLQFKLFGIDRHSDIYLHDAHRIWGLTAKMISSANLTLQSPPVSQDAS